MHQPARLDRREREDVQGQEDTVKPKLKNLS